MTDILKDMDKFYQSKFLGKKIKFYCKQYGEIVGKCNFIGHNPNFPSWEFQITVGRTPYTNINPKTVKLYEESTYNT